MSQPQRSNPADALPDMSRLSLMLDERLQAAIDVYAKMVAHVADDYPEKSDSQMAYARNLCAAAQVMSHVSNSAIPADFYKVYAQGMGIPGADAWKDEASNGTARAKQREQLKEWCEKLASPEVATRAATKPGAPLEEVLWLARRGAYPFRTLTAFATREPFAEAVANWDSLVDALGGTNSLQSDQLVKPTDPPQVEEDYNEALLDLLVAVLTKARPGANDDPLALFLKFRDDFDPSMDQSFYEAAASQLQGGQMVQARFLIDEALGNVADLGFRGREYANRIVANASTALAQGDHRSAWAAGQTTPLQDVETLIAEYRPYTSKILLSAIMGFSSPSDVRCLAVRHIHVPGHPQLIIDTLDLLALLLYLQGVRPSFTERQDWQDMVHVSFGDKFLALVGVVERLPQPQQPPNHLHFINTRIADTLLHNAAGTRTPSGAWMVPQGWQLEAMEMLLQGLEGHHRFSRTAVEKAIGAMFGKETWETISKNFSWRLQILRELLKHAKDDWLAGPNFIDEACIALNDLFRKGIRPYIMEDRGEDPAITFRQFRTMVDAFRDAGVVFYAKESTRIQDWLRKVAQSAVTRLERVMGSPEPWTAGVPRHAHKYGIARDLVTLIDQIVVQDGGTL
jgi:hypothetical protein